MASIVQVYLEVCASTAAGGSAATAKWGSQVPTLSQLKPKAVQQEKDEEEVVVVERTPQSKRTKKEEVESLPIRPPTSPPPPPPAAAAAAAASPVRKLEAKTRTPTSSSSSATKRSSLRGATAAAAATTTTTTTTKDPFRKGATVTVARRKGPGVNKPGGVGKITRRNEDDGTFDIHYMVEGNREKRVALEFITPGLNLESDSLFGNGAPADSSSSSSEEEEEEEAPVAPRSKDNDPKQQKQQQQHLPPRPVAVLFSGDFPMAQKRSLRNTVLLLGGQVLGEDDAGGELDWGAVTHLVIETTKGKAASTPVAAKRSEKYLRAVATGTVHIVNAGWLTKSAQKKRFLDASSSSCVQFEVVSDLPSQLAGLPPGGPQRSRADASSSSARSLLGANLVAFAPAAAAQHKKGGGGLDVQALAVACGARLFDAESAGIDYAGLAAQARLERLVPLIIVSTGDDNAAATAAAIATLPSEYRAYARTTRWLVECIATYTLL